MSYTVFGQIPDNGNYLPEGSRAGVLGQIPTNGAYIPGGARAGVFGQIPINGNYLMEGRAGSEGVFARRGLGQSPAMWGAATYDDGGLQRVRPDALPAAMWSLNSTTNTDPAKGATTSVVANYLETYEMNVASGAGDNWLDAYLGGGYVILFLMSSPIGTTLPFFVTMDPRFVADNAATKADKMVIVTGNEAIISAAKALLGGSPIPSGVCPPGTIGLPPACVPAGGTMPTVPTVPSAPTTPSGGCPPGQIGFPPFCIPTGGVTPPVQPPAPTTPTPVPPGVPAPKEPAPAPVPQPIAKAGLFGGKDWVLPVLVGVGAVSLFALMAAAKKKTA